MQAMTLAGVFGRLEEFECLFQERFSELQPQILADILVSEEDVNELGRLLGYLIRHGKMWDMRKDFPLTTALFLVWCTVYNYKEGNLWEPLFAKLGVIRNPKTETNLGNTFLAVIEDYNLLPAPDTGKPYMTPILMHGYISNYYAIRFLDYLNAIYFSYLECDLSESALETLWAELFNISDEKLSLQANLSKLIAEEEHLLAELNNLHVPEILEQHTQATIQSLDEESKQRERELEHTQQKLLSAKNSLVELEELRDQFTACEQALAALDLEYIGIEAEATGEIVNYNSAISELFSEKINELKERKRYLEREEISCLNRYKIARDKYVICMTEVVKLGSGDLECGFAQLNGYQNSKEKLRRVQKQKRQLESLLAKDHKFGNTTLEQVLTTSLTSLSAADPFLFREFIRTALEMLDVVINGRPINKEHVLYKPLIRWHRDWKNIERSKAKRTRTAGGLVNDQTDSAGTDKKTGIRISMPSLHPPAVKFDPQTRTLLIDIPAQTLIRPRGVNDLPQYILAYRENEERIAVYHHNTPRQIMIDSALTAVKDSTIEGLFFKWLTVTEYWDLTLDPVMVFNEEGKLMPEPQLANGFYHILARRDWTTEHKDIVDSYPCNLSDYIVYEVFLEEASISFESKQGESVVIRCSRLADVKLCDFNLIPGLSCEDMPVGRGKPKLLISRALLDLPGKGATLSFDYNGGRFYKARLKEAVRSFGKQHTPEIICLDLAEIAPLQPAWSTFNIQLSYRGQAVFTESFCLVRGFNLEFQENKISITVPRGSKLEHGKARKEGRTYIVPFANKRKYNVRVYFDKVGWKQFTINVPGGKCQLIDKNGTVLAMPLQLLKSERQKLQDLSLHFTAYNDLVYSVEVFHESGLLHRKANLARGTAEFSLIDHMYQWEHLEGNDKLYLQWKGIGGCTKTISAVEIFEELEVTQAAIFPSEQEEEYLLELTYKLNFAYSGELRFRVSYQNDRTSPIFDRRLRNNPDHFYLRKDELKDLELYAEIYFVEHESSVFGTSSIERVLWSSSFVLSQRKVRLKKAMTYGIILKSFLYQGKRYELPHKYHITEIRLSPKHFEGDQLMRGVINVGHKAYEVFFYLEDDSDMLTYLWDADDEGVQYDPRQQHIFWEWTDSQDVMGPLDDLEFEFGEVAHDESESG